jgi:hypothetical protein
MTTKGYQVIEPTALAPLLSDPSNHVLAVMTLSWLIEQLQGTLGGQLEGVSLEVIRVEYHGAYPALGVHYTSESSDLGPVIEACVEGLLRDRSVGDLVEYVVRRRVDWAERTATLLLREG